MADNSDLQKIQASEKPTSDDFEYAYVETVNKAFVRIAKERLKEILGANRYTNEEIDQKLSTIPKFNIEVVSSLPTTDISETTIYLVSSGDDSENLYTEYININGLWEILGTQKSTFSGSAKDVTYDDTETKLGATNVQDAFGKLSATVNDLKDNGTGSGVTTAMSESLWAIVQKTAFAEQLTDAELTAFKTEWGITEENGGEDEPVEPDNPEVTLSSILATYTGGNVVVGTSVNSLTGVTVKATYSDGSTKNVTGYTLSGTIKEGNNTITVSYGGKTTTFTVTGIAEVVDDGNYITPPCTLPTDNIVAGYIGNNGVVTALANSYIADTFIKVTPNNAYNLDATGIFDDDSVQATLKVNTMIRYAWYDSTKSFISRSSETLSTSTTTKQITAPATAEYIKIAVQHGYMTNEENIKYIFDRIAFEGV